MVSLHCMCPITFILTKLNTYRSYRVLGFIILGCSTIACLCLRERVRTADKTTKLSQIFNFEVLKDLNFVLWVLGSMIGLMGFFVPYFFLPCKYHTCILLNHITLIISLLAYITYLGMSTGDSATIIAVLSAANFVGRITIG